MGDYHVKNAVAILTFNRIHTTKKLLELMKIIKPSRMYVIIDAPRKNRDGEVEQVNAVKQLFENEINWNWIIHLDYVTI